MEHDDRYQSQTNKLKIGSLSYPPLDPLPQLFINDTTVGTIL